MIGVFKFLFALLFFYAAYIQLNDPDPVVWISLYVVAGSVSLASYFKNIPPIVIWVLVALSFIWAATLIPATLAAFSDETKAVVDNEEAREFFGLLIIGTWNIVLAKFNS